MDDINKFLKKLNKKERQYLKEVIFLKIRNLDLKGLKLKKLSGYSLWRVRYGRIRIVFAKTKKGGLIIEIGFRTSTFYKQLNQ